MVAIRSENDDRMEETRLIACFNLSDVVCSPAMLCVRLLLHHYDEGMSTPWCSKTLLKGQVGERAVDLKYQG